MSARYRMTNKIKTVFAVLAISAGLSAYEALDSFRQSAFVALHSAPSGPTVNLPAPDNDADHDGLSNHDESYWETDFKNADTDGDGFKDGEEVASGHDPTVPGPNDVLGGSRPQNITQKVNGLVLAGLVEGSLDSESPNQDKSLDMVVDEIFRQSQVNSYTSPSELTIVADTDENNKAYAQTVGPLLTSSTEEDFNNFLDFLKFVQTDEFNNSPAGPVSNQFFDRITGTINSQTAKLESLPVPKAWENRHRAVVSALKDLEGNYRLYRSVASDPFQGIISFTLLNKIMFEYLPAAMRTYVAGQIIKPSN